MWPLHSCPLRQRPHSELLQGVLSTVHLHRGVSGGDWRAFVCSCYLGCAASFVRVGFRAPLGRCNLHLIARRADAAADEAQMRHIGGGKSSCTTSKNRLVGLIMAVSDSSESGHFGQVETMRSCRAGAHNAYSQHGHGVNCEPV